jgi:hypothetical protein
MRTWTGARSSVWADWVARADRHASTGTVERVHADLYEGHWCMLSGRPPAEGFVHFRHALERARQLGDDTAFAAAAGRGLTYLQALPDLELIESIARELTGRSLSRARTGHLANGLLAAGRVLLSGGDRDGAERAWQQLARLADDRQDPMATMWATAARCLYAILRGQFAEAFEHMHAVENAYRVMQAGVGTVPRLTESAIGINQVSGDALRVRLYLGQVTEAMLPELGGARPFRQAGMIAARTLTLAAWAVRRSSGDSAPPR